MPNNTIPLNKIHITGSEINYINDVLTSNHLCGDGEYSKKCQKWIENEFSIANALLTQSCTAALELAALSIDLKPSDEIIMPSFTFVTTASAFALRGAVPVFVDIRPDTLNIDESLIESAITSKTKAIVPVHYAGIPASMDTILDIARFYGLYVIEDAAQGLCSTYKGKYLGSMGHLGAISFHETKNIISGEGGCLFINDNSFFNQCEIIREKGTDRSRFYRGEVDKYTWQCLGSSFLPSEITSAFLLAQLENSRAITRKRVHSWNIYHKLLEPLENFGCLRRPTIPDGAQINGHIYYVLLDSKFSRDDIIKKLKSHGIATSFHYIPLHSSPAGLKYCRIATDLKNTNACSEAILRLPLWYGLTETDQEFIINTISEILLK